jgi:hypothetical protein
LCKRVRQQVWLSSSLISSTCIARVYSSNTQCCCLLLLPSLTLLLLLLLLLLLSPVLAGAWVCVWQV